MQKLLMVLLLASSAAYADSVLNLVESQGTSFHRGFCKGLQQSFDKNYKLLTYIALNGCNESGVKVDEKKCQSITSTGVLEYQQLKEYLSVKCNYDESLFVDMHNNKQLVAQNIIPYINDKDWCNQNLTGLKENLSFLAGIRKLCAQAVVTKGECNFTVNEYQVKADIKSVYTTKVCKGVTDFNLDSLMAQ